MLRFFLQKIPVILLLLTVALILCGSYFRILENNEQDTLDMRFRLRPALPTTEKIVIIEIGEDTLEQLGRFPLDRSNHALMVKALSEYGAKSVMFDIFFSEPKNEDFKFEQAVKAAGNVYLPYVFEIGEQYRQRVPHASGYAALNIENLAKAAKGSGHINVIPDSDGKYRRVPLFVEYRGALSPYLSFRLACDYLGIPLKDVKLMPGRFIQCGSRFRIPLDENSNCLVNYAGKWGDFYRHYSYVDVLRSYAALLAGEKPLLDLNVFRDKICLIGLTATGTTDLHPSPFSSLYPALGIHSDLANSIIQKRFISRAPKAGNLSILLIICLLTLGIISKLKPLKGFCAFVFLIMLYAGLCVFVFDAWGLWLDMFYPVFAPGVLYLACLLAMYVRELKNRLLLEKELQIAKRIQESFLPKSLPACKGAEVSAAMFTAREVGGDLYDFYEFSPESLGIIIGDVSGKGIPAALFMTKVTSALKFLALPDVQPQEALHDLNMKLLVGPSANLFVTVFYSIFDLKKRVMRYANAGHLPAIYIRKNAAARFLDVEDGFPLGMVEGPYLGSQVSFVSGDTFVFYTDGITEAMNSRGELYGKERLVRVVQDNIGVSAQDILTGIGNDVRSFEPKHLQHDDISIIVIRIT